MSHEKFMRYAIEESRLSITEDELPVGAVMVWNNEIISISHKTSKDNPRLDHSEIKVLRHCMDILSHKWADEMTIYTTLEPCIMCFGTLLNCRIGTIVYSVEDSFGGISYLPHELLPQRHRGEHPKIIKGILREEARSVFREFFLGTKQKFWKDRNNPLVKLCLAE